MLVGLEVLGQVRDTLGEDSDLNLGGTGVALVGSCCLRSAEIDIYLLLMVVTRSLGQVLPSMTRRGRL